MSPIHGRRGDTSGRPYVEGRLLIPRFRIQEDISFLVDTGADRTMLMPVDGARAGIDYNALGGSETVGGVSGVMSVFVEPAAIIFNETGVAIHIYQIQLTIAPPGADLVAMGTPSLLGRDVIDRWRMTYSAPENILRFDILGSDLRIPITPVTPPPPAES